LQLVKIATVCCAALIMIEFVEVDAFKANVILVIATAVGPFKNSMSTTFNARLERIQLLLQWIKVAVAESLNTDLTTGAV